MSGTGPTPAEQHLGDRLAALVDGELTHDARDRVLAHLATCPKCKAEADAQRRLKSVFAQAALPPPSEGLLARLQSLPAGPAGSDDDDPAAGPFGRRGPADGVFGALNPSAGHPRGPRPETFGYVPEGAHAAVLPGGGSGFRIHDVGRSEAERSPWLGRRFAFAAASAVSFAAIALGGTIPLDMSADSSARGQGAGKVTPLRTAGPSAATGAQSGVAVVRGTDAERRRTAGNGVSRPETRTVSAAVPGEPATQPLSHPFAASLLNNPTASLSPLIRPTGSAFQAARAPGPTPSSSPVPTHLAHPKRPSLSQLR
ncbi:anti-sigma factor family protein [Streptomyces sp. NPDC002889]|uniref:anti-sigma factor family protein n=1 Tax=Streptomyces sp. NPDC002889 TaxID=3364669 RepID=UPI0036C1C03B